jgi:hypothetical protein
MTKNVFAGTWEIAAENGMNKSIARFPDVCMSPPSPPAGPIPIPYPDTSFSSTLKSASTTVLIGGKGAALAQKSYYKESVLGDEAATRTFGANVVTHQITGKTYFQAWCMDVKFESKNVCRHFDITTSNHASGGTTTAPLTSLEMMAILQFQSKLDSGICPCCNEAAHEWQKDADGKSFKYMTERHYWAKQLKSRTPGSAAYNAFEKQMVRVLEAKAKSRAAGAAGCANVHPNETDPCALYLDIPKDGQSKIVEDGAERTLPTSKVIEKVWKGRQRDAAHAAWANKLKAKHGSGHTLDSDEKMNHMTPKIAGGCGDAKNITPQSELSGKCAEIEAMQSKLERWVKS